MVMNCLGRSSDGGRPMCKLCGMTGADITRIKNHIESMHWQPQLRTTYSCELCGASCKTKHGLACHKSRHHSKKRMIQQMQQQAAAASINQNGAGGVNLSTLAAAAAVQQPSGIMVSNQTIVASQASAFSADSVALAALAAVKEPIPLQTNLARVGAPGRASTMLMYNQQGAIVMPGGGVANPAAAYIPIGGAIIGPGTSITNTTVPLNNQAIMRPHVPTLPVHKGYATVSKASPSKDKDNTLQKLNQIEDPQMHSKENNQIESDDEKQPAEKAEEKILLDKEPYEKTTSLRKNTRKAGENPFVDEEVSNSPVPDPSPSETSRKATSQKKTNKRKSQTVLSEESQPNINLDDKQSEKSSKLSPEKSKNNSSAKAPKKTPTRSKRGRKRY